jgi:hypothetical protein
MSGGEIQAVITEAIKPFTVLYYNNAALRKAKYKTLEDVDAWIKAKVEGIYEAGGPMRREISDSDDESANSFHDEYGYVAPGGLGRREWLFRMYDRLFHVQEEWDVAYDPCGIGDNEEEALDLMGNIPTFMRITNRLKDSNYGDLIEDIVYDAGSPDGIVDYSELMKLYVIVCVQKNMYTYNFPPPSNPNSYPTFVPVGDVEEELLPDPALPEFNSVTTRGVMEAQMVCDDGSSVDVDHHDIDTHLKKYGYGSVEEHNNDINNWIQIIPIAPNAVVAGGDGGDGGADDDDDFPSDGEYDKQEELLGGPVIHCGGGRWKLDIPIAPPAPPAPPDQCDDDDGGGDGGDGDDDDEED